MSYYWLPSPNHGSRRGHTVDVLVIHWTGGHGDVHGVGRVFAARSRNASSHYSVGRTGDIGQHVEDERAAWHAGDGLFPTAPDVGTSPLEDSVNRRSIGIELCNRGFASSKFGRARGTADHRNPRSRSTSWEAYTDAQIHALRDVVMGIRVRNPSLCWMTGHEDVTNYVTTGGGSKLDPGPLFPWGVLDGLGMRRVAFNFGSGRFEVMP